MAADTDNARNLAERTMRDAGGDLWFTVPTDTDLELLELLEVLEERAALATHNDHHAAGIRGY